MFINIKVDIDNKIFLVNGTNIYISGVSSQGQAFLFGFTFCGIEATPDKYIEVVKFPKDIKHCSLAEAKEEIKKGEPICIDWNLQKHQFNQNFNKQLKRAYMNA